MKVKKYAIVLIIFTFLSCKKNTGENPTPVTPVNRVEEHAMHELATDYDWASSTEIAINLNETTATTSNAKNVNISAGKIKIVAPGNYRIKGNYTNGQIVVDDETFGVTRLILDNANIACANSSAIYIKNANRVIIVVADNTTNKLSDGTIYDYEDKVNLEPSGTIYSKEDLSFAGTGKLNITGNFSDGISSNDGLIFKNANVSITAKDDAIRGKDYVIFRDGNYNINAGQDGIKGSEETDGNLGYVIIDKGTYNIAAADDGLHAESEFTINNGNITVEKCREGLEGKKININGGNIWITANDDGVNCADGTDPRPGTINGNLQVTMKGGNLYINSIGDGLDSNGNIEVTGGNIVVQGLESGGNAPIDYDGNFVMNGGSIIAIGAKNMAQMPGTASVQNSVLLSFNLLKPINTAIRIQNVAGEEVMGIKSIRGFNSLSMCHPNLKNGDYEIWAGGTSESVLPTGILSGKYTGGTLLGTFTVNSKNTRYTVTK